MEDGSPTVDPPEPLQENTQILEHLGSKEALAEKNLTKRQETVNLNGNSDDAISNSSPGPVMAMTTNVEVKSLVDSTKTGVTTEEVSKHERSSDEQDEAYTTITPGTTETSEEVPKREMLSDEQEEGASTAITSGVTEAKEEVQTTEQVLVAKNETIPMNDNNGNEANTRKVERVEKLDTLSKVDIQVPKSLGQVGRTNFERIRLLGRGAVGKVYFVKSKGLEKDGYFAMKKLDKLDMVVRQKVQRAINEKHILGKANHPFIVTLHYCFQTAKSLYLVMQYCAGGEFAHLLQSQPGGVLPVPFARFYASEVLLALEYLHVMGFVYRDLKPGNILVHASGHIMLADFDLSYISESQVGPQIAPSSSPKGWKRMFGACGNRNGAHHGRVKSSQSSAAFKYAEGTTPIYATRATSFVGTDEYMAPEVIIGEKYSGKVDWWSYGILLYEMVVGTVPFEAEDQVGTFAEIADAAVKVVFPNKAKIPKSLRGLVRKLLMKDKKKRLTDPFQMKQAKFFKGVDWALVRNQRPPIIPELKSEDDTSNFPVLLDDDAVDSSWAASIQEESDSELDSDDYEWEDAAVPDSATGSLVQVDGARTLTVDTSEANLGAIASDGSPSRRSRVGSASPRKKSTESTVDPDLFGEFTYQRAVDPHWEKKDE